MVDCVNWYMGSGFPSAVSCAGGKVHLPGMEIPETTSMTRSGQRLAMCPKSTSTSLEMGLRRPVRRRRLRW